MRDRPPGEPPSPHPLNLDCASDPCHSDPLRVLLQESLGNQPTRTAQLAIAAAELRGGPGWASRQVDELFARFAGGGPDGVLDAARYREYLQVCGPWHASELTAALPGGGALAAPTSS